MGVTFALVFAGCSSGATSHLTPSSDSGSSSQNKTRATVKGRIFIPGHTKATASAKYRAALSTRSPKYVSAATMGVAIKTETAAGVAIDNTAFSTNSDDPNCTAVTSPTPGTNCTFTVGALAPTTTFLVTAYDAEPSVPAGGPTSAPAGNALSTASLSEAIIDGQPNTVNIALGGVVANYTLTSTTPNIASTSRFSLAATGASQTVTIAIAAQDADGYTIATQTTPGGQEIPYANPITFTAAATGDVPGNAPHTTLTLSNTIAGTTAQTTSPYTSSYTGDTFTLTYDGINDPDGPAYNDAIAGTITTGTDAYSGTAITPNPVNNGTLTFAPLTAFADLQNDGDSFSPGPPPAGTPLALTFVIPLPATPPTPPTDLRVSEAGPPTGSTGYSFLPAAGNTCMGVTPTPDATTAGQYDFSQPTAPTNDTAGSTTCVFNLSDGTSVLPVAIYYNPNATMPTSKARAFGKSSTRSNAGIK